MTFRRIPAIATMTMIAMGMILTLTTAAVVNTRAEIITRQAFQSSGSISSVNVSLYSDSACSSDLTSISWGDISPGGSVTRIIYVKNTGYSEVTLSLAASNWNPAETYEHMTLTWDKEGIALGSGEVTMARLTLSVSQNITQITDFSVTIIITGTA